jgi:hypothetical protein
VFLDDLVDAWRWSFVVSYVVNWSNRMAFCQKVIISDGRRHSRLPPEALPPFSQHLAGAAVHLFRVLHRAICTFPTRSLAKLKRYITKLSWPLWSKLPGPFRESSFSKSLLEHRRSVAVLLRCGLPVRYESCALEVHDIRYCQNHPKAESGAKKYLKDCDTLRLHQIFLKAESTAALPLAAMITVAARKLRPQVDAFEISVMFIREC